MPNRILKESITTSENLNRLTAPAEVLFYRLMVVSDDFGRGDARPQIIRARCFPLKTDQVTAQQVQAWIDELTRENLVFIYQVDGNIFYQFTKWDKHNRIRAAKSKFPEPATHENTCKHTPVYDNTRQQVPTTDSTRKHMIPYTYSEADTYSETNTKAEAETEADTETKIKKAPAGALDFSERDTERIDALKEDYPLELVDEACKRAVKRGKPKFSYVQGILQDWYFSGLTTLQAVLQADPGPENRQQAAQQAAQQVQAEKEQAKNSAEAKRRAEKVKAACEFIKLNLQKEIPNSEDLATVQAMAAEYGQDVQEEIINTLYGGVVDQ